MIRAYIWGVGEECLASFSPSEDLEVLGQAWDSAIYKPQGGANTTDIQAARG